MWSSDEDPNIQMLQGLFKKENQIAHIHKNKPTNHKKTQLKPTKAQ